MWEVDSHDGYISHYRAPCRWVINVGSFMYSCLVIKPANLCTRLKTAHDIHLICHFIMVRFCVLKPLDGVFIHRMFSVFSNGRVTRREHKDRWYRHHLNRTVWSEIEALSRASRSSHFHRHRCVPASPTWFHSLTQKPSVLSASVCVVLFSQYKDMLPQQTLLTRDDFVSVMLFSN